MRLLSARVRDYRIHRDLAVEFDPRFTVIAGPNQSGKSTLAEALHRALFLPVKTGGELQKAMQTSPFLSDPEVELTFEAGSQRWTLRKRFAASRGSASLTDDRGVSLQGEEAEERLAQLVGTTAVARNRGAVEQLRERWGHLWVWQGSASSNPLTASQASYDHDRLVERLQAGGDLGVTSALDLAVLEDIQGRWDSVYTPGGANRAPQVRKGSVLQLARAASEQAQEEWHAIEAAIAQQASDAQTYQQAIDSLSRIGEQLPLKRQQVQVLQQDLVRSRELQEQITNQQPLLDAALKELTSLGQDRSQLQQQLQRIQQLTAEQAPARAALATLRETLPALESSQAQTLSQLEAQQRASAQSAAAVPGIEAQLIRLQRLQERGRIQQQLAELEQLRVRFRQLSKEVEELPAVDGPAVERLRQLLAARSTAETRAEALATGLEVIRADAAVLLDGEVLEAGASRQLCQPALLKLGDAVEVRLLPGGGSGTAQAAQTLERAQQALTQALASHGLTSVEEAATLERRRSDLLAERQRLVEKAQANGEENKLRLRLQAIERDLEARAASHPTGRDLETMPAERVPLEASEALSEEQLQSQITSLEAELLQARSSRDAAQGELQRQQSELKTADQALAGRRQAITSAEQALRLQDNQLLEARTLMDSLLQRHGSLEALQEAIKKGEQRLQELQTTLDRLRRELNELDPERLTAEQLQLNRQIAELERQEGEANEARIRAEERLHSDGSTDLQAELEQKQAELESRLQEQERLEKEAGMLTLLRRLLDEEQNAMGSQYTTPIVSRLRRFLGEVFPEAPEATLRYDARGGFQGLQWRRGNESAFGFEVLSTGAREQFAASLRIAMAEVLAEAYDGCLPVLFDDAFANSDPERQAGVYRMLMQAADQGLQVLLLTCDLERSQAITGASQVVLGG